MKNLKLKMKSAMSTIIAATLICTFAHLFNCTSSSAQSIAGGGYHSLYLCNDKTPASVGNNSNGQLGDGTTIQRNTPVQVSSLNGITAIAGGGDHSLFLKNDGTVWACGYNLYGELGDGTTTNRATPMQVSPAFGGVITAIAGGFYHSLFLKNDGTVWACGWNLFGELGDGTTTDRASPVQVSALCTIGTGLQSAITNHQSAIRISPNPFSHSTTIEISNAELGMKNAEFRIYDLLGRKVHHQTLNTKRSELNTNLPSGIYFYKISNEDGNIANGKLVVSEN